MIDYKISTWLNINDNIYYKTIIKFEYKNRSYNLEIFYNKYNFSNFPQKIYLNNLYIFDIYKRIIRLNTDILNEELYKKSILFSKHRETTINNFTEILAEIIYIINLDYLHEKRIILNKIINKYTTQNMDYLHKYLVN